MGISYFNMCRISQWLNPNNCYIKLHALVSRSELHWHILKIQLVNGLNIQEIFRGSINSDCKFYLPNVFSFRQNLMIYSKLRGPNLFSANGNYNGVDSNRFLGRIFWLYKLVENRSKLVCCHWSEFTDLEKTHGSVNWKISMIVATIMFQYPFKIKAN